MAMLKATFHVGLVLFGAIALFVAVVFFLSTGLAGPITIAHTEGGRLVTETVTTAADPGRYFRLQVLMGFGPLVLGAIALWLGIRWFRR